MLLLLDELVDAVEELGRGQCLRPARGGRSRDDEVEEEGEEATAAGSELSSSVACFCKFIVQRGVEESKFRTVSAQR